jgi:ATP-dependent exoDNAse (exonuclease V) alpha subunit
MEHQGKTMESSSRFQKSNETSVKLIIIDEMSMVYSLTLALEAEQTIS